MQRCVEGTRHLKSHIEAVTAVELPYKRIIAERVSWPLRTPKSRNLRHRPHSVLYVSIRVLRCILVQLKYKHEDREGNASSAVDRSHARTNTRTGKPVTRTRLYVRRRYDEDRSDACACGLRALHERPGQFVGTYGAPFRSLVPIPLSILTVHRYIHRQKKSDNICK